MPGRRLAASLEPSRVDGPHGCRIDQHDVAISPDVKRALLRPDAKSARWTLRRNRAERRQVDCSRRHTEREQRRQHQLDRGEPDPAVDPTQGLGTVVANDALERAVRKSTPQRRAIYLRAERWCDPQRIRECRETEVCERCRSCREAEFVDGTSRADWSDVGGNVGECAELSKRLDAASFRSRTAPADSMNRDRNTGQCCNAQHCPRTSSRGLINRIEVEHGAEKTVLGSDGLQPRVRVGSRLSNPNEKTPIDENLSRSTIARVAESNIERLVCCR